MAALLRASLLLSASALLCALLLCTQGSGQVGVDSEGDCKASNDGEDSVSYLQHFASKAQINASSDEGVTPKFFREGDESDIPRPGADYPEQLRGVIWLDQEGVYGFSDTGAAAPDLLVSFAESLDKTTRKATLNPGGRTWTWQNNHKAYAIFSQLRLANFMYDFEWNEDYTEARIYPSFHLLGVKVSVWSFLADFRMVLQKPAEGECPPKPGASKEEVSKCALWIRRSWVLIYPVWNTYPVFRVLDEAGHPIAPYYDEYVAFAKSTASPDLDEAEDYLGKGVGGVEDGLWFAGPHSEASLSATESEREGAMTSLRQSMPSFGLL